MSRLVRVAAAALCAAALVLSFAASASAQRHAAPRRAPPPHSGVLFRGHVFVGGYFYDPFWGPYPWWPRTAYPYWYFPTYDRRAEIHVKVTPDDAAVYVDGFYAGIVDDFDGIFQSLPLPPGGHNVTLYLEGYRTARHNLYLGPGSSIDLHDRLERLPPGVRSEPPFVSAPVPPPPDGSYTTPRAPSGVTPLPPSTAPPQAVGYGALEVRVQPRDAEVTVDGQRWVTSDGGRFMIQMPAGMHRIAIEKRGYQTYSADIEIRDGQTTPLNVSLMR